MSTHPVIPRRIKALAPGQFGIVSVLLLCVAFYFAYQYVEFPIRQAEETKAMEEMYASADSSTRTHASFMLQRGTFTLAQAESAQATQADREERGLLAVALRQGDDLQEKRPLLILGAIITLLILSVVAWIWFGRKLPQRQ